MNALPILPGSYLLHLRLEDRLEMAVGRLGLFELPPADYFYLGSACGPGGLRARLGRHLRGPARPGEAPRLHWHIDYLRQAATVLGAAYRCGLPAVECAWSQAIAALPGAILPAPGFGSSDCHSGCPAHLVAFPHQVDLRRAAWLLSLGVEQVLDRLELPA